MIAVTLLMTIVIFKGAVLSNSGGMIYPQKECVVVFPFTMPITLHQRWSPCAFSPRTHGHAHKNERSFGILTKNADWIQKRTICAFASPKVNLKKTQKIFHTRVARRAVQFYVEHLTHTVSVTTNLLTSYTKTRRRESSTLRQTPRQA